MQEIAALEQAHRTQFEWNIQQIQFQANMYWNLVYGALEHAGLTQFESFCASKLWITIYFLSQMQQYLFAKKLSFDIWDLIVIVV